MEKLKTLKDIDDFDELNPNFVSRDKLKQKAIKHIRDIAENGDVTNFTDSIKWIKHFFNITEEDLK